MSADAERNARLEALEDAHRRALELATSAPPASIALSLATLIGSTVADERKDYQHQRDRECAFADELARLVGPEGNALPPANRNARLRLLAEWLRNGYDGPPREKDYAEELER